MTPWAAYRRKRASCSPTVFSETIEQLSVIKAGARPYQVSSHGRRTLFSTKMISMRVVLLIATVVVSGRGAEDVPAQVADLFEEAAESSSVPQERSKRTDSSAKNETSRNKRQIPCCYGNPYPIITLPSCSIPYTVINGTCYLATCPKPCNTSILAHTTCCRRMNPNANPLQHLNGDIHLTSPAVLQEQSTQKSKVKTSDDSNQNSALDINNNTTKTDVLANSSSEFPPKTDTLVSQVNIISSSSSSGDPPGGVDETTTTSIVDPSNNNTTPTSNDASSSTSESPINPSTVGTTPDKRDYNCSYVPYFWCENNSTSYNTSGSHDAECEVCQCFCNPVYGKPELQLGKHMPEHLPANSVLANCNYDAGCSCCNYSPLCSRTCSYCDNILGLPRKETAGLMRGSGNGEGGNTIISNMNILAGPSCVDPCGNQNACMLSNSGNGDGGNKIVANANYVNGGNLLCCSGNGRGGNCIRTMVNIVGGNSAKVLSSCDGELLKRLCNFMNIDDCSMSESSNGTDPIAEPIVEPITEPKNTDDDNRAPVNNTIATTEVWKSTFLDKPLNMTEVTPAASTTTSPEPPMNFSPRTSYDPPEPACKFRFIRPSQPRITCDRHLFFGRPNCMQHSPSPNYILIPNNRAYC